METHYPYMSYEFIRVIYGLQLLETFGPLFEALVAIMTHIWVDFGKWINSLRFINFND